MRIGFALPQFGVFAEPDFIIEAGQALEKLGCDSLWTGDRILGPLSPSDPYPGGGEMPKEYVRAFDPLAALTLAAVHTSRVRLGTSTLNALWQPPVMLARSLTSLDLISAGRLDVGIGLGWMRDEYAAAGVPWQGRGDRLEETLDLLDTLWTDEVVEHGGPRWTVPPSRVDLKPCQRPRPPILLAGFSPAGLDRIGRRADGWLAVAMPLPFLEALWATIRQAAEQAGRDPGNLRMVLRTNPRVTEKPVDDGMGRAGTVRQISEYLLAAAGAGAHEVLVDLQTTASCREEFLDLAAEFAGELQAGRDQVGSDE